MFLLFLDRYTPQHNSQWQVLARVIPDYYTIRTCLCTWSQSGAKIARWLWDVLICTDVQTSRSDRQPSSTETGKRKKHLWCVSGMSPWIIWMHRRAFGRVPDVLIHAVLIWLTDLRRLLLVQGMESSRRNTTQRCWRFETAETSDAEGTKKTPNPTKVTIKLMWRFDRSLVMNYERSNAHRIFARSGPVHLWTCKPRRTIQQQAGGSVEAPSPYHPPT